MSVQRQDAPSVKVAIPGVSGTGKTTLCEKLIRRERAKKLIFDHKGGDFSRRFGVKPCWNLDDLVASVESGGMTIYNPGREYPGHPEKGFAFFCDFVFQVCTVVKGRKLFVADELDMLVDSRSEPEELCIILDQGRTFEIGCIFICQAMNGIHNQVRKQFTEVFAFRQGDKNGVDWLEEKGFDREKLTALKNGQWLYKNLNTGETASGGKAFNPPNASRNLKGL